MRYQPVIGLEIHCELLTDSKVFCGCQNEFGGYENTRVCPRCSGMPGTLPIINQGAVYMAAKAGFATDCTVNKYSAFDRKNYFYPDLPKAYQITQFSYPICSNGYIQLNNGKKIRINRIHIEEDAGKLTHDDYEGISMADYNRCGVPLIEIVTEPDFRSSDEVLEFVEQIALRLKYAGVCDAKMEQGSLRVDVNISIMPLGSNEFGTRAEIKNLNSFKSIDRAIEYEIHRQSELLDSGKKVIQETRRFNDNHGNTKPMRSKEKAHDYRYFPEPDIPPIELSEYDLKNIKSSMPELPHIRFERYTQQYSLPAEDAHLIISSKQFSDFYDAAVNINPDYKLIANIMLVEVNRNLNETNKDISNVLFKPDDIAELAELISENTISKNASKDILKIMFETGENPKKIAKEHGFIMKNDVSAIDNAVNKVLSVNENNIQSYQNGNEKLFGFFMGQIMRELGSSGNPKLVKEILTKKLQRKE